MYTMSNTSGKPTSPQIDTTEETEWSEFSTWEGPNNDIDLTNVWQDSDSKKETTSEKEYPILQTVKPTAIPKDIEENVWSEVQVIAPSVSHDVKEKAAAQFTNEELQNTQDAEHVNSKEENDLSTPCSLTPYVSTSLNRDKDWGDFVTESSDNGDGEFGDFETGEIDVTEEKDSDASKSTADHNEPCEATRWMELLDNIYPSQNSTSSSHKNNLVALNDLVNNDKNLLNSEITLASLVDHSSNDDGVVKVNWRGSNIQKRYIQDIFGCKPKETQDPLIPEKVDSTPIPVPIIPIHPKVAEGPKKVPEVRRNSFSIPELTPPMSSSSSQVSSSTPVSPRSPTLPETLQPISELAGLKFYNIVSMPNRQQLMDAHYLKQLYYTSKYQNKDSNLSDFGEMLSAQEERKTKALKDLNNLTATLASQIVSTPESLKKSALPWTSSKFSLPTEKSPVDEQENSIPAHLKFVDTARQKGLVINTGSTYKSDTNDSDADEFGDMISADSGSNNNELEFFESSPGLNSSRSIASVLSQTSPKILTPIKVALSKSFTPISPTLPQEPLKESDSVKTSSTQLNLSSMDTDNSDFGEFMSADNSTEFTPTHSRHESITLPTKSVDLLHESIASFTSKATEHSRHTSVSSFASTPYKTNAFQDPSSPDQSKKSALTSTESLESIQASEKSKETSMSYVPSLNASSASISSDDFGEMVSADDAAAPVPEQNRSTDWYSTTGLSFTGSVKSQSFDDFGAFTSAPGTTFV